MSVNTVWCKIRIRIRPYAWFSEPYSRGLLNVCYTMNGWSSNNDSYHFGVKCTSIMPRKKRWTSTPVCNACWFQYHSMRDHIWKHNLFILWCPSYNSNYVKGTGKVSNMFTILHIVICDKRPSFRQMSVSLQLNFTFGIIPLNFNDSVEKTILL